MKSGWAKFAGIAAAVTGAVYARVGGVLDACPGRSRRPVRGAKALAQTAAVLRSMGRTESAKGIENMLDTLSKASGIDDDNLREMTNTLLTFGNVTGDTFGANVLALDLSVAFGKDCNRRRSWSARRSTTR